MPNKTLVLVDGSYFLFRAYHALPKFSNPKGEPTGAIYGVVSMLKKLLADHDPDYFAVVFDAEGGSFRNELYEDYKANRPEMPEDLSPQIGPVLEIIPALGLPLLVVDNVEADDVLATLATLAEQHGIDTTISSGDKDLAQIVNRHITLVNPISGVVLDPEGVKQKYGVPPERIVDYLSLVGDSVDNVPGVPKVGPKTAAKWLAEYGSLDEIMRRAAEFPGKVGEYLRESLGHLPLTRQLVTLKCDVPLPFVPEDLRPRQPDLAALRGAYERWAFRSWLNALQEPAPAAAHEAPAAPAPAAPRADAIGRDYETVLDLARLKHWLQKAETAELFAFDTETTGLDYVSASIVGFSLSVEPGKAAYVPLAHDGPGAPEQLDRDEALALLRPLLESPERPKLGHNLKFDINVLARHGIALRGVRHDSMLESFVLDSGASRHDMDTLAERHLSLKTIHYEDVAGKGAKQIPFNQVDVETASAYAAEDADVTLRLHRCLWQRLSVEQRLRELYESMEIPLVPVLSRMECNGVLIDAAMLKSQGGELARRMSEVEQQAHAAAGQPFNIGSPRQIQAILYDKLQLKPSGKTPKGQLSTAESVLQELAELHELPRLILEHRALSKLKSTYTDRLPQQIRPRTGRVHTSYHQAGAATGRLSSSDPNLQNIPIRTEEGRRIRRAFVAPEGSVLLAADYSQIELRIMAHLSADPALLQAFAGEEDVHRHTAAEVFGVPLDAVTGDQRRAAKAINFGLIYGMSPFGLAKQLNIERGAAREYVDRYFARYPGVRDFMDRVRSEAGERGYVETVFGRRLYLPDIKSRNAARRQYAERTAINAPMQGTAADIIKRAMIAIDAMLAGRHGARMIMQVHDELVFEIPAAMLEELRPEIIRLMAGAADLDVPLRVDARHGRNWDEAH